MRAYLRRLGYPAATHESTIERLRALNYVNDESFARNWALARARDRGYGPRRIEQELKRKGIAPSVIREVVREAFEQYDELAQARQFLTKRFRGESFREPKALRRAVGFLQRRGYSARVISELLHLSTEEE
jgi:regulatory protein